MLLFRVEEANFEKLEVEPTLRLNANLPRTNVFTFHFAAFPCCLEVNIRVSQNIKMDNKVELFRNMMTMEKEKQTETKSTKEQFRNKSCRNTSILK